MKKVLITGGTRGIGTALAVRLFEDGFHVIATGKKELDITSEAAVYNFRKATKHIDVLINCAAVNGFGWKHILDTNIMGTVRMSYNGLMMGAKKIINFAGGGVGGPNPSLNAPYVMSKAAVVQFTECLAREEPRLQVNCVSPGNVRTDMNPTALEGPEAVCNLVSWLASDFEGHLTGKLLSAKWDDLEMIKFYAQDTCTPRGYRPRDEDMFTLRRLAFE